ncbi:substrate-binding periplasmic protein [Pseudomonas mangrovi]|jgi:polar amino acid transport system substrate-binding protein|uniref:Amino acid ABC transporter substrate-binding protein n=1 Tax=Pseudomonas mangrovi TaxID=2161748 RepID=A0A2T5PEH7_9PSED|nr:ABC transporter substrate-binding protein [Pseudomonas mangrovi]PTU76130.1 amino acid ABC transporter substrate-binding protein [Pseudomonas mangrovi]
MRRLLFWLLLFALPSTQAAEELRLTNGEWAPYLGAQLPHHGIASRIVAEAFALEGIEVRWEFHPWARSLLLAERGDRHGSAVWLSSPHRKETFFVSDPILDSTYYLFHRKDRPLHWESIEDLAGLRLGATTGYDYGEPFQRAEAQQSLQIRRLGSDLLGFRQLLAGRLDAFPMDKVVGFDLLHEQFSSAERARLSFHPRPLRSDSLHLLLSRRIPQNADYMLRFNAGLARLRESGKVSQYLLEAQRPLSLGR